MSDITVENLQIAVEAPSTQAEKSINSLADTLGKLKNATKNLGLNGVAKQISTLNTSLNGVSSDNADKLNKLAQSLQTLSSCGKLKLSSSVATQITSIGNATRNLNGTDFSALTALSNALTPLSNVGKSNLNSFISQLQRLPQAVQALNTVNMGGMSNQITQLVSALAPLTQMGKNNLTSFVTQLQKLPQVMSALRSVNMSALASQIQQLANALSPLATQMQSIANGFSAFPARIQRLIASTNNLSSANRNASLSYVNLAAKIAVAYVAIKRLATSFANMVSQAVEWDGISYRFGRAFGESAQESYEWVQRLNKELNINTQLFMQYSSIYGTMLTGYGVAQKDAATMAMGYAELTYDIWAGFNDVYKSYEDAAVAVRSAIAGEVEPIRKAGFTIVDSQLKATAAMYGIEYSTQSATEELKSYLRYLTLVNQAYDQNLVGTYAREMNTAEGLLRTLRQQVYSLAQTFGSIFLPIITKILPYVQAFVSLLKEAVIAVANLFGVDIQPVDFSNTFSSADSSTGGIADNLDEAATSAKKLKSYMLGIDELNVISPTDNSGSGGGGAGGAYSGVFDINKLWDESIFKQVNQQMNDIVARIKEWLGLTEDIDTWSEFFHTRLGRILTTVGAIGLGLATWKISQGILSGVQALLALKKAGLDKPLTVSIGVSLAITGIALEAAGIIDAIQNELNGMNFAQILSGGGLLTAGGAVIGKAFGAALLGGGVGAVIAGIPAFITGIYDSIKNGIDWLSAALTAIGGAAAGAGVGAICAAAGTAITPGIGTLIGLAVGLVVDGIILIVQNWETITTFLSNFFTVTVPGLWNKFTKWLSNIPKELGKFFKSLPGKISDWFDDLWQPIQDYDWKGLGYDIGQWFGNAWKDAVEFITVSIPNWFTKMWNGIKSAFKTFFTVTLPKFFTETIPSVVEKVGNFFKELPQKIYNAFVSAKTWIVDIGKAIIDGIWEGLQSIWKAITDFVDGFVQGFKDALGIASPSKVFIAIGEDIVAGLLSGIKSFTDMMATVKEWAGSVVEWFVKGEDGKGIVEHFKEIGGNIISGFKDKVSTAYTNTKNSITTWASKVKDWFTSSSFGGINWTTFSTFANNTIEGFKNKVSTAYTNVKSSITTWASKVKEWFTSSSFGGVNKTSFATFANETIEGFRTKIGTSYVNVRTNIATWAKDIKDRFTNSSFGGINSSSFSNFANETINGFKNKISSAYTNVRGSISTWASDIKNRFTSSSYGGVNSTSFSNFANETINGFKNKITNSYTNAQYSMQKFGNSVVSWFKKPGDTSLVDSFINIGANIIQGFLDGVSSLWDKAMKKIKEFGQSIISKGKEGTEEHSPSRAFRQIGAFVIEGFNLGIEDMIPQSYKVMNSWLNGINAYQPVMSFGVDTSALKYYNSGSFAKEVSADVRTSSAYAVESSFETDGFEQAVLNALVKSGLVENTRRQADKQEKTEVHIGNRVITEAVTTQRKANGYVFAK